MYMQSAISESGSISFSWNLHIKKKRQCHLKKVPIAFRQWEPNIGLSTYGVGVAVGVAVLVGVADEGIGEFVTLGVAVLGAVVDVAAGADEAAL